MNGRCSAGAGKTGSNCSLTSKKSGFRFEAESVCKVFFSGRSAPGKWSMRRAPGVAGRTAAGATVALVGFEVAERAFLREIFECLECPAAPDCKWKVRLSEGVESNLAGLRRGRVPIVFWDGDRMPEAWKGLLEEFASLSRPPLLILTSRLADDRLWAEALNLGAYDVLAKPFDPAEVVRTAGLACLRWRQRQTEVRTITKAVA